MQDLCGKGLSVSEEIAPDSPISFSDLGYFHQRFGGQTFSNNCNKVTHFRGKFDPKSLVKCPPWVFYVPEDGSPSTQEYCI